jgi:hypothetical protein
MHHRRGPRAPVARHWCQRKCGGDQQKGTGCLLEFSSNNYDNDKHAYAGQLNSFTYLRALLVLYDGRIFGAGH